MYCSRCGTQNPNAAAFCAQCGSPMAGGQPVQAQGTPAQVQTTEELAGLGLRQYKAGVDVGVRGIPAFIIGNNGFMGAQPYEAFQRAAQEAMSLVTPKE